MASTFLNGCEAAEKRNDCTQCTVLDYFVQSRKVCLGNCALCSLIEHVSGLACIMSIGRHQSAAA